MKEHQFVEVIMRWVDTASPSTKDVKKVWKSVNCKELCDRLEYDVVNHVDRGLTRYKSGRRYKYSDYRWELATADIDLLVKQGYFNLCSTSVVNSATQCGITSCSNKTHPCYMLTVHNGRYCVVDSECAEGGLAQKGERGHKHSDSVIHYWLVLYKDGADSQVIKTHYAYHSLLTNSVEYINTKISEFIQSYRGVVSIFIMYDKLHDYSPFFF